MNKESLKVASVFLTVEGVILLVWYLRLVDSGSPIQVLFAGVGLLAVGNVLAFASVDDNAWNTHFLFVLFISMLVLSSLYDIRFNTMQGSDVLFEYKSARVTLEEGFWSLTRSTSESYFSAISVSFVPAILSMITGQSLLFTFQVSMRLIAAILPLVLFFTVKEIFENVKIAALSAVIFSQTYFNAFLLPSLMRQYITEIFLVLAIFVLVRTHKKRSSRVWSWTIPLVLFLFGLATYHYTVAYWVIPIVGAAFLFERLIPSIPRRLLGAIKAIRLTDERKLLRAEYLLLFMVFFVSWTALVGLTPFVINLHNEIYLITGGKPVGTTGKYQTSWLTGSPAGPITTAWLALDAALGALGFIYFVFKYPKRSEHAFWGMGGLVMFVAVAIWITPSFAGGLIYLDRVYLLGLIFFVAFAAGLLVVLPKKFRVFLFLFLFLNLPMNMLLASHQRYVLYHKEAEIIPTDALIQNIVREPSFVMSTWLDTFPANNTIVYADDPTGIRSLFYLHEDYRVSSFVETPLNYTGSGLFAFHYYNLVHGLWQTGERTYSDFSVDDVLNRTSVVYNNGEAALVSFP